MMVMMKEAETCATKLHSIITTASAWKAIHSTEFSVSLSFKRHKVHSCFPRVFHVVHINISYICRVHVHHNICMETSRMLSSYYTIASFVWPGIGSVIGLSKFTFVLSHKWCFRCVRHHHRFNETQRKVCLAYVIFTITQLWFSFSAKRSFSCVFVFATAPLSPSSKRNLRNSYQNCQWTHKQANAASEKCTRETFACVSVLM